MLARGLNVGLSHHVRAYFMYATKSHVLADTFVSSFFTPSRCKESVCLHPSVCPKCTREILHHLRNYLKYMSTNKTNESVSSDEPSQIRTHSRTQRRLRQIIMPLSLAPPDNYAHMPSDRRACKLQYIIYMHIQIIPSSICDMVK